jgi:hypothetical protein
VPLPKNGGASVGPLAAVALAAEHRKLCPAVCGSDDVVCGEVGCGMRFPLPSRTPVAVLGAPCGYDR